jgi:hypothetical protein
MGGFLFSGERVTLISSTVGQPDPAERKFSPNIFFSNDFENGSKRSSYERRLSTQKDFSIAGYSTVDVFLSENAGITGPVR